jgi:hypothetical protein
MKLAGKVHSFQSEQLAWLESIYIMIGCCRSQARLQAAIPLSVEGMIEL